MADSIDFELEHCLSDLLSGRSNVEDCLKRHPAQAAQLTPLLHAAARLNALPAAPMLAPARRQALENRVLARVSPRTSRAPARVSQAPFWRRGWTWAISAVMLLTVLTTTAVGASAQSLPGELLYPVKRLTEQVVLTLTPPEALPAIHAELAQRRLLEFVALVNRGDVESALLNDVSSEANEALDKSDSLPADGQAAVLKAVDQVNEKQVEALTAAFAKAPEEAKPHLNEALTRIEARRARVKQMLGQPTPVPPDKPLPGGKPDGQPNPGKGQPPSKPPGQSNQPDKPGNNGQGPPSNDQGQGQGQAGKGKSGK